MNVAPTQEPRTSKYAQEGSFAHFVAEKILRDELFFEPTRQTFDGQQHVITPELIETLRPYTESARKMIEDPNMVCGIELGVVVPGTGNQVYGTTDFAAFSAVGSVLVIMDLKFGSGVKVDADTPQTALYALGTAAMFDVKSADTVIQRVIVQPRGSDTLNPIRTATTTLGELREWFDDCVTPAIRDINAGDIAENPGNWCQFCPRKMDCRAKRSASVLKAFENLP